MTKSDIPVPICATCGESGEADFTSGETFHLCTNCGTEMKYMPAGELLHSGGNENNGWAVSFSVRSSEAYSSKAMFVLGLVILLLSLSFLLLGKIGMDAALWSIGSGIGLVIIGKSRSNRQKKKLQLALEKYPYWKK